MALSQYRRLKYKQRNMSLNHKTSTSTEINSKKSSGQTDKPSQEKNRHLEYYLMQELKGVPVNVLKIIDREKIDQGLLRFPA